jgi:hypothetical protein
MLKTILEMVSERQLLKTNFGTTGDVDFPIVDCPCLPRRFVRRLYQYAQLVASIYHRTADEI